MEVQYSLLSQCRHLTAFALILLVGKSAFAVAVQKVKVGTQVDIQVEGLKVMFVGCVMVAVTLVMVLTY